MSELLFWRSSLLASVGVSARFYGRQGGVSRGAYASLNLGLKTGDDPAAVAENEKLVLNDLGVDNLYLLDQVHGNEVHLIRTRISGVQRGGEGDGSLTELPGIALGVLTADCVPLLIANAQGTLVGAVHVGWRNLMTGVISRALERAFRACACRPGDLIAAIGPAVAPENYEVDRELAEQFTLKRPELSAGIIWPDRRKKPHLDLRTMVIYDLLTHGLSSECIEIAGPSADNPNCYSHRRDPGPTGRQLSVVVKKA